MTVIAWDGTQLVADKRASNNGATMTVTKIRKVGDCLVGFCGDLAYGRRLVEWFSNGADPEKFPAAVGDRDGYMVAILPGGVIHRYEGAYPAVIEDKFYAMGSGRDFALAVMHLGYGSKMAVEVTCKLSTECGNGIDVLELG